MKEERSHIPERDNKNNKREAIRRLWCFQGIMVLREGAQDDSGCSWISGSVLE
jgi:hypothetical protein